MSMPYHGPVPRIGNVAHVLRDYPPTSAVPGTGPSTTITMAQGPVKPWANEEEAEEYARDPKTFLLKKCEQAMGNGKVAHNWVLIATHWLPAFAILPNGTRFYRSDNTLEEVQYQGKVGLVIGKGPMAFVDDPDSGVHFHGQDVDIGEWISFDRHDGRQTTINRVHCRYIKDVQILQTKIQNPDYIY